MSDFGFWVFMLIINLQLPLLLIIFSFVMQSEALGEMNTMVGYRTRRAMRSKDTWRFANTCFAKMSRKFSIIMTPITILGMLFCLGKDIDSVSIFGMVVLVLNCIVLVAVPMYFIESALKKNFNEDGTPKTF